MFTDSDYTGLDIGPGKNVDVVSLMHEYKPLSGRYDTVISTQMLEHDMYWGRSLHQMFLLLKPGGLMLLHCATGQRKEHGTLARAPEDSPLTVVLPRWAEYYKNLDKYDIINVLEPDINFSEYEFNVGTHDLGFYGIKRL